MKRYQWTPFVLAVLFALQGTAFAEEPGNRHRNSD